MRLVNGWIAAAVVSSLVACEEARDVVGFTGASSACATCHSAPDEGPPFRNDEGATTPGLPGVGAHTAHLTATRSTPLECRDCHVVPRSVSDPGHVEDRGPADVVFGPLASARGAAPAFDGSTCAVYCHGQFPGGNSGQMGTPVNLPAWTGGPAAAACGSCHGAFPAGPPTGQHQTHVERLNFPCDLCHGPILRTTHVNGLVNLSSTIGFDPAARTCQVCHGPAQGPWDG